MALVRPEDYPTTEKAPDFISRLNWCARYMPDETEAMFENGSITKAKFTRLRRGSLSDLLLRDVAVIASSYGVTIEWLVWGAGETAFDWVGHKGLPLLSVDQSLNAMLSKKAS
ncbi:hypothetical protein [Thiolapillus sp.]|uniref:hypothetical protein n=4 Tax=Thiolapillus sp. TaxID=2017437 RepID=UPI0025FC7235|nr:hypothetical protein [Thiolapillus sp.]